MARRRSNRRELRSGLLPPGASHSVCRAVFLVLLFLCLQGMVILFGGTRFWASGPFLAASFLCLTLFSSITWFHARTEPGRFSIPMEVWVLFALALYAAVRAFTDSPIPYESWTEAYLLLAAAVIWVAFSQLGASKYGWLLVSTGLIFFAMMHCLHALRLHILEDRSVLWLLRPEHYGMRASGTFICPNHFGHYVQMAAIVGVGLLFIPRLRVSLRIFIFYSLCFILPTLVLTLSRAAVLGALAGIGVVVLLSPLRKRAMLFVSVIVGGLLSVAGAAILLLTFYPPVRERLRDAGTNNIRWTMIWPDTVSMIRGEGFWGSGPGTYPYVFDQYREKFNFANLYLEYAHNEYLHTLAEYGWVPLIGILVAVGVIVTRDLRGSLRAESFRIGILPTISLALVVATLVQAVFDFQLHITANSLVLAMLLGTLHGAASVRGLWPKKMISTQNARRAQTVMGVLSAVLLVPSVVLAVGSYHSYQSRQARLSGQMEDSVYHAAAQRRWLPSRYEGWRALGLEKRKAAFWMRDEAVQRELIEESRQAYAEALRLNPYDRISRAGLIELLKMEKRWEEALVQIDELIRLSPFDVQVRIQKGLALKRMKRNQEALEVFQEAKRMRKGRDRQIELNIRTLRKRIQQSSKNGFHPDRVDRTTPVVV